jgi:hypothetical protein
MNEFWKYALAFVVFAIIPTVFIVHLSNKIPKYCQGCGERRPQNAEYGLCSKCVRLKSITKWAKTNATRASLIQRTYSYFGPVKYAVSSQSENTIVLQGPKEIDGCLFAFLLFLFLFGALIYWVTSKSHQVIVHWENGDGFLSVTTAGNTEKAKVLAGDFLRSLPETNDHEMPCPSSFIPAAINSQTEGTTLYCHKCGEKTETTLEHCLKCGSKLVKYI